MTLYKRANGVWHVKVMRDGKYHYASTETTNKTEARAFEAEFVKTIGKRKEWTLDEVGDWWIRNEVPRLRDKRNAAANYRHILPHIKSVPCGKAGDVTGRVVSAFKRLAPATVNRRLAVLRKLVSTAYRNGWCDTRPSVNLLAGERRRNVFLTKQQVIALAKKSGGSKWHILFLAFSGMRVSEMYACRVESGVAIVDVSKNGKPRVVPLHPLALYSINVMDRGRAYRTIWSNFKKAVKMIGLGDVRLHDLRHSHASWHVKAGTHITVLRDILGHSSLSVTSRYTHLGIDQMRDAINKI